MKHPELATYIEYISCNISALNCLTKIPNFSIYFSCVLASFQVTLKEIWNFIQGNSEFHLV